MRLAVLEAKMALASVLRRVRLERGERTAGRIEADPTSFSGGHRGGLWIRPVKRNK